MAFSPCFDLCFVQSVLSGHLAIPRGWPLNAGSTALTYDRAKNRTCLSRVYSFLFPSSVPCGILLVRFLALLPSSFFPLFSQWPSTWIRRNSCVPRFPCIKFQNERRKFVYTSSWGRLGRLQEKLRTHEGGRVSCNLFLYCASLFTSLSCRYNYKRIVWLNRPC